MDGDGWAQHMIDATRDGYNSLASEKGDMAKDGYNSLGSEMGKK